MVVPDILRLECNFVSPLHSPWLYVIIKDGISVFDYTYLIFWNSFWTIAPVIGIGLFDRIVGGFNVLGVICKPLTFH
jgi:hypothetical protein